MRSSRNYIYAAVLVILALCSSCRQELCYNHFPSMEIGFSWEREWERDYGMNLYSAWDIALYGCEYNEMRPSIPEWVKMVRYSDSGQVSERFLSPDGARLEVEGGEDCSILFYNGDTEYIILSDVASMNDVRATATTRTRSSTSMQIMQELYKNSRTTNPPDVIYAAYVDRMEAVKGHEVRQLPIKMQPLVYTYLVTFEFEYGIQHVVLARGALGGMAEGVYLRTGVTTDETSIILFDCDIKKYGCQSAVRSFGIPSFPDAYFGRSEHITARPYHLNLEVKLVNGETKEFDFDITEQLKKQPRGGVIRVSGLRVEDIEAASPSVSGGFDVDVTGWGDKEDINVPIDPA